MTKATKTDAPEEVNNLALWESVQETDPNYTKQAGYGSRTFTAIDAYYQIKNATEKWGTYGDKWGLANLDYNRIADTPLMRVSAVFYYPTETGTITGFEINSAIKIANTKGVYDDDFAKKVETDLLTKSLSKLGFNSDVFLGKFDDNKYTQELTEKYTPLYTDVQKKTFDEMIETEDAHGLYIMSRSVDVKLFSDLYNSFGKGQKVKMKQVVDQLVSRGREQFETTLSEIIECIDSNDGYGLKELTSDLGTGGKTIVWEQLSSEHQSIATELLAELPH